MSPAKKSAKKSSSDKKESAPAVTIEIVEDPPNTKKVPDKVEEQKPSDEKPAKKEEAKESVKKEPAKPKDTSLLAQSSKKAKDVDTANMKSLKSDSLASVIKKEVDSDMKTRARRTRAIFGFTGAVLGIVTALIAGVVYLQQDMLTADTTPVDPTPTVAEEPAVTPTPTFDRSRWTFEILNGSGIAGHAGRIAEELEELGYVVTDTGNADATDYIDHEIYIIEDMMDDADGLLEDIAEVIAISTISGELTGSAGTARIILGVGE